MNEDIYWVISAVHVVVTWITYTNATAGIMRHNSRGLTLVLSALWPITLPVRLVSMFIGWMMTPR